MSWLKEGLYCFPWLQGKIEMIIPTDYFQLSSGAYLDYGLKESIIRICRGAGNIIVDVK